MKLIRGTYEKILRSHESVWGKDYNIGDYYLQYDYPNNFIVNLYCIVEDNEGYAVEEYILNMPVNRAKTISCKELKSFIKEVI